MRWPSLLTLLFFIYICGKALAAPVVEHGESESTAFATLDKRQETTATTDTASQMTATAATDNQATTATAATSSDTMTLNADHATHAATTVPSLDGSSTSGNSAPLNVAKPTYAGGLPIQPELTPALGVGGFILLFLGGALALIGIRKQWLYTFLSTAFLAALGVTVLIIYVMNPPISNAVQGGYLVAVFFTGAILGGIALVFREITEGLGCLLGGFCIGMWLLTLKAGGLVSNGGAKVGFIIAFTVAFYCLSFSHYTRSYGLIVCLAFSGATALVLGIDCFSRAGLKEFWLYIWGLNEEMFPLNTYTYPVTRSIQVEVAVIIIVAVFGVIAQLRLWKVIKERRLKEESSRRDAERQKDEAEAEVGRQLEKNNLRERAEWEHMYGNGQDAKASSLSETAVADDSRRGSDAYGPSTREKGNSFEMKEMATVRDSTGTPDGGRPLETVKEVSLDDVKGGQITQTRQSEEEDTPQGIESGTQGASRPASFISHQLSDAASIVHDDDSEHGAVAGSEAGTPRSSKRFSRRSWMTRVSWRSGNSGLPRSHSQSEEALVHEDATSSVAGAVDDLESISSHQTSFASGTEGGDDPNTDKDVSTAMHPGINVLSKSAETKMDRNELQKAEPNEEETEETPETPRKIAESAGAQDKSDGQAHGGDGTAEAMASTEVDYHDGEGEPKDPGMSELDEQTIAQASRVEDQQPVIDEEHKTEEPNLAEHFEEGHPENSEVETPEVEVSCEPEDCAETATGSNQQSQTVTQERSKRATLDATTVQSLPEQTSKVVHKFRTKEWARHLADAEAPELEPLDLESEVNEDSTEREAAAPVDVDGLLQTAFNAQPPPIVNGPEQTSPVSEPGRARSYYSLSPSPEATWVKSRNNLQDPSVPRSLSQLSRNVSSASFAPQQQGHVDEVPPMQRSTSTPFLTVTAPRSNAKRVEATDTPKWSGPPPLLTVRESRLRNRISSTSVRYDPWASRNQSRQSFIEPRVTSPTLSIPEERDEDTEEAQVMAEDEDDLPLSKRRAMLQRQTMRSPSAASSQSFEPASSPQWSPVESSRSAVTMATWRHSVREDIPSKRDPLVYHASSPVPLSPERPQSLWGSVEQMRAASATKVDIAIAEGMQRGSMTDLHRQAMRRMQASANRQL